MPDSSVLSLLGLARKAGLLETGEEPVGAACRARHARLVMTASDAASNTVQRAETFCRIGAAPLLTLPFTKLELGLRLNRGPCAILALTDAGFAAAAAKKLAAQDPSCAAIVADLQQKADRVLDRQREQKRHDKNLRKGKQRPWAPPPPRKTPSHRNGQSRARPPARSAVPPRTPRKTGRNRQP